jgi:putative tricarboxylic transport membrane protein
MKPARRRLPGEIVFVALLLMIAAFFLWQSIRISGFSSLSSAGSFPMAATLTMVVSGLWILLQTLRSAPFNPNDQTSVATEFRRQITPNIVLAFVMAVVWYAFALEKIGFVLASFLYLMLATWQLGSRNVGVNLLTSVGALIAIYVVFRTAFSVVLPKGTLLQAMLKGTPYLGWLP